MYYLLAIPIIYYFRNNIFSLICYTYNLYSKFKNKHIIEYIHSGKKYKLFIESSIHSQNAILFAKNEHGEDITTEISEFAGPNQNFDLSIRPYQLGYDKITIETLDNEYVFEHNTPIKF